jgi:signal transduction histidine kinase
MSDITRLGTPKTHEVFDSELNKVLERLKALEQRTVHLERWQSTQNAITQTIAASSELDGAVLQLIQIISEGGDWDFGELWDIDPDTNVLVHRTSWHIHPAEFQRFAEITRKFTFPPGIGLPGRVWRSAQAAWIPDVVEDNNFPRAPFAARDGLHSGFGLPICANGKVIGVMSFFSRATRQPQGELVNALNVVGRQIGLYMERKRAEEQERKQVQLLAVAEERQRLAQDLHSMVAETIFSTAVMTELLPYLWDTDLNKLWYGLAELRNLTQGTLNHTNNLLTQLGAKSLAEVDARDLLEGLVKKFAAQSRLEISLKVNGDCPLPTNTQVALYCIAQEALQNVVQHSHATHATVFLTAEPAGAELRIGDNGKGFNPDTVPPNRLGLRIMRGCAESFGATLDISTKANAGTQISLRWRSVR